MSQFQYSPVKMQTTEILQGSSGRSSFRGLVARRFRSIKHFEIFCFQDGLLFIHVRDPVVEKRDNRGAMIGAMMGGAIGAVIGGAIDEANNTASKGPGENLSLLTDEELFGLAKARKASFIAPHEHVKAASFDPPGFWSRNTIAGYLRLKVRRIGKLQITLRSAPDMMNAIQALQPRLGDRLKVNVAWSERNLTFVAIR